MAKYDAKLHPQLVKWMARAGLTSEEIADQIGISKMTLHRWAGLYPEVKAALKESRSFVDSLVEDALLKRALGYRYKETKINGVKNPDGSLKAEKVEQVEKEVHPDTGACMAWLKNRQRPGRDKDERLTWMDSFRVQHEQPPEDRPPDELTNDELDAKIRDLERALQSEHGEAAAPGSPGKPDTLH